MRNVLLITLSLMLLSVGLFQSSTAYGQRQTCALALKLIESNKAETDELKPITGARATATKLGSRRTIPAVMIEGQPHFPELTDGDYRITITKRGFKRTILPITFICLAPSQDTLINIKLEHGSSTQTVANEKLTVKAGVVISSVVALEPAPPAPRAVDLNRSRSTVVISGGILNSKAISLPKPPYPAIARTAGASGVVSVQVMIGVEGNVISARAVTGHPLLRAAAVQAARAAKFTPTRLAGQPAKVTGLLNYIFTFVKPGEPKAETD